MQKKNSFVQKVVGIKESIKFSVTVVRSGNKESSAHI